MLLVTIFSGRDEDMTTLKMTAGNRMLEDAPDGSPWIKRR